MHHRKGRDFRWNPRNRLGSCSEPGRFAAGLLSAVFLFLVGASCGAFAQCPPERPPLQNYTDGGQQGVCPCFIPDEEAGVILDAPTYPIEILRVGIAWGSQFGGQPQTIEHSVNIYPAGLPNPGTPIYSLLGPVMTDGVINEFNLEPEPGEIVLDSGPFTVSLRFLNQNSGNIFAPSVVFDSGCQPGKNAVKAIPGGWADACALGVSGDWVMYVIYRDCSVTGVGDEHIATNAPVALFGPRPNPFVGATEIEFLLAQEERVELSVYDVRGRRVAVLEDGMVPAGRHQRAWNGKSDLGVTLPAGIYFLSLRAGDVRETRKISYIR